MKKQPLSESDMTLLSQYGLYDLDLKRAVRLSFEKGEYLSREGEPLQYLYFVVSGKAKVLLSLSDGKQLLLAHFISKGIIGDVELMTDVRITQSTLQAVTQFVCIALPFNEYRTALKNNNAFINYVGKELAEKLMQRAINGAITTLQPLETRLCAYITQTASEGFFCETLTEVAGVVGASYRHLLRCLDRLCHEGILLKEAPGYRIVNQKVLDSKAGDFYVLTSTTKHGDLKANGGKNSEYKPKAPQKQKQRSQD